MVTPGGALPARAAIEVNVTHVGFPGVPSGDLIRAGSWIPVIVDVALTSELAFDGSVRAAQPDSDGDQCFDEVELHLRADTGGARRVFLYIPANPVRTSERFAVEVRNDQGEIVRVVSQGERTYQAAPGQQPEMIAEDDILILHLSSAALGRFSDLAGAELRDHFVFPVHVAHMSPTDLPELWIGLDAVDYVIWDDARPEELTARQLESLLDWARHGGTLLIAASRSAGSLRLSKPIDAVLPVDLGEVTAVANLPDVRQALLDPPKSDGDVTLTSGAWLATPFPSLVPVVRATRRKDGGVLASESSLDADVLVRDALGAGHIVFMGVTLNDLLSAPGDVGKFVSYVLRVRPAGQVERGRAVANPLYEYVVSAVAFATSSSLYLLMAAAFSVLYALAATFGTWKVLTLRGWRHHSWTAFAGVAVVASAASLMMVGWMHGFGDRLHQIAVVDADAGAATGHATAFFGLKTSVDKVVDLWLPSDWVGATEPTPTSCFLRPLPEGGQSMESGSFADPDEYRLAPASAVIDGVRIRGTLKRFEGRWEGPIGGRLSGQIGVRGRTITEESYVINELGATLSDCYLLQPVLNTNDIAGSRDQAIYAFPIGEIPADGAKVFLHPRCYRTPLGERLDQIMRASELEKAQMAWSSRFMGLLTSLAYGAPSQGGFAVGLEKDALMLVSTLGEFESDTISQRTVDWGAPQTWSRDRLRRLDLRPHLHAGREQGRPNAEPGMAVLIGFAPTPGPMRLFSRWADRDFRPVQPDAESSWCMYRIRIPMTRLAGGQNAQETEGIIRGVAP
jgi:hypothetical protein